jgi:hypothetical protein
MSRSNKNDILKALNYSVRINTEGDRNNHADYISIWIKFCILWLFGVGIALPKIFHQTVGPSIVKAYTPLARMLRHLVVMDTPERKSTDQSNTRSRSYKPRPSGVVVDEETQG